MESEFKSFEQQWEAALQKAAIPPPDIVWDNIEKELDKEKKKRGVFFWWKNPAVLSGIAAALVLGLTYIFVSKTEKTNSISENKEIEKPVLKTDKSIIKGETSQKTNSSEIEEKNDNSTLGNMEISKTISPKLNNPSLAFSGNKTIRNIGIKNTNQYLAQELKSTNEYISNLYTEPSETHVVKVEKVDLEPSLISIDLLEGKKAKYYANRFKPLKPYIVVDIEDIVAETKSSKNKLWFGLNSGLAPFDPNYNNSGFTGDALASARNDAAFSSKNSQTDMFFPTNEVAKSPAGLTTSIPESSFKNGRALNFGFSFGKKFKKRLGIESGFRFTQASSSFNSNVYSINESSGKVNSFFQANYLNTNADNAKTQTVISVNAINKQLYNYLNIPLLLNYSIPVYKNLGVEAISGVSGDMFVFGNFDSANAESSNLNAGNSSFNLFNISGMGGLRVSYNFNQTWEANIGSTYQQALLSGISSEQNLSFKPKTFGVNYGIKYKMR
ncbi:hypothetical protein EGI22_16910 [Lacihabitans sp. LS3-19]|uniref:hypothetical protein n=1 Tax=Lacihabitans sp. LS3-19 TaxID=2487335 RepID=UPI0020CD0C4E|nr:hypothetical protein [Lacihabitans sp. LS3-19]MCP9769585.1 hypothetical protein [Lacihabitans sp. LS3-19]